MQNEFESATQEAQKSGAKANVGARAVRDRMRRTAEDVQEQFASAAESTKERICAAAVSVKGARGLGEQLIPVFGEAVEIDLLCLRR